MSYIVSYNDSVQKIKISEECDGCGVCTVGNKYITEKDSGKAIPAGTGLIAKHEVERLKEITNMCPYNSISFENAGILKNSGAEGLRELKSLIEKERAEFRIPLPEYNSYAFKPDDCTIFVSRADSISEDEYRSESKAESEGLRAFDRVAYSKRRSLIQEAVIRYKSVSLEYYYKFEPGADSFYTHVLEKAEQTFHSYLLEVQSIAQKPLTSLENLTLMDITPNFDYSYNHSRVHSLEHLEETGVVNRVMNELPSLSDYKIFINTDCVYEGEGFFDPSTYDYDCYEAIDELIRDISRELDYMFSSGGYDIRSFLESSLVDILKEMEEAIKSKYEILLTEVGKML